jgi:hypothetical protein
MNIFIYVVTKSQHLKYCYNFLEGTVDLVNFLEKVDDGKLRVYDAPSSTYQEGNVDGIPVL